MKYIFKIPPIPSYMVCLPRGKYKQFKQLALSFYLESETLIYFPSTHLHLHSMEQFPSLGEPDTMDKKLRPEDYSSYKIQRFGLTQYGLYCRGRGGSLIVTSNMSALKRHLLLGRKVMTNLDSIFKNRNITLPTKVHLVKAMVFPVVMYGCESWTVKKAERRRIDAFEL